MADQTDSEPAGGGASSRAFPWWQTAGLLVLSAAWESLFIHRNLSPLDEGWPLYAAMQLSEGGTLYRDVFFVFPPGHLLPAWIAWEWKPPGVIAARQIYAAFNVALCLATYFLGRRIMPPAAALLGAGMLAVATPDSHGLHYLFGYRYLVWSVLALLCFARRLETGDRRWMVAAGALSGLALLFRLTPAAAVVPAIALATIVANRSWRARWQDGLRFAVGFALPVVSVAAGLAASVGWETLWSEIVVRPVAMTQLQSLPLPPIELPGRWTRWTVRSLFVAIQFRLFAVLLTVYVAVLAFQAARALAAGRSFRAPMLLAVAVWAGVYFVRSLGRADESHLDSTLPPMCLLMAHAVSLPLRAALEGPRSARLRARLVLLSGFAVWVLLVASDRYVRDPDAHTLRPVRSLNRTTTTASHSRYRGFDRMVREMRLRTRPEGRVLDLTGTPLLYVVAGRRGPGGADVVMPGTFLTEEEEEAFVARLRASPPALAIRPLWDFDGDPSRSLASHAPRLAAFVADRYRVYLTLGDFELMRLANGSVGVE